MENVRQLKAQLWNSTAFFSTGSYLNDNSASLGLLRSDPRFGRFVLASNAADQLVLWDRDDVRTEDSLLTKPIAKNNQPNGRVADICWYPYDQSMFAVLCGSQAQGMIYGTEFFQPLVTFPLNYSAFCCQFSSNATAVAFGCKGMIRLFDFRSKSCISTIKTQGSEVTSLYWDDTCGNRIYYGSSDGTVEVADCKFLECLGEKDARKSENISGIFQLLNVNGQIYSLSANSYLKCHRFGSESSTVDFGKLPVSSRSSWKEPKSVAACPVPNMASPSLMLCNGENGFGLWDIYARCFVKEYEHSTLKCPFPYLEYNHQLEEVYLYNNSKIAAIFERRATLTDAAANKRRRG